MGEVWHPARPDAPCGSQFPHRLYAGRVPSDLPRAASRSLSPGSLPRPPASSVPSRRAAILLGAGLLAGCAWPRGATTPPPARCVAEEGLALVRRLGTADLPYEMDGKVRSYRVDEGFVAQLEGWLTAWNEVSGTAPVTALSTYGLWTPGDCASWHTAGRAFDIARVSVGEAETVSCRHDLWRTATSDDPARATAGERGRQRSYWRLAASLHASFAYVLTYHFDALHDNHIHVDDSVSKGLPTRFDPRSRVQCQAVAAIATWVHEVPAPVTGSWDATTSEAVRTVLRRLGIDGTLTDQGIWQAFLTASARG